MFAEHPLLPGYAASPWFDEQVREVRFDHGVRGLVVAPLPLDPDRPTRLIVFATPNGNTVEQTLGCARVEGRDWHYDIQHVAAQVRRLREVVEHEASGGAGSQREFPGHGAAVSQSVARENLVVACLQPEPLSWPAWRREHEGGDARIRALVDSLVESFPGGPVSVGLTGHSGGGSFIFGYIDASEEIPAHVDRIAFLDANYGYADEAGHGGKLLTWLGAGVSRHLVVLAYDDRAITLNGKRVVGPTGGTFRASHRMLTGMGREIAFEEKPLGPFTSYTALDGRLQILLHTNPGNLILHTRLVGEMNGLLFALTAGTPLEHSWGALGPPRAYTDWVQPAPFEPDREPSP